MITNIYFQYVFGALAYGWYWDWIIYWLDIRLIEQNYFHMMKIGEKQRGNLTLHQNQVFHLCNIFGVTSLMNGPLPFFAPSSSVSSMGWVIRFSSIRPATNLWVNSPKGESSELRESPVFRSNLLEQKMIYNYHLNI